MATLYFEFSFAHHGIKGQKWGVRRFQNPDGTLTNAGKTRAKRNAVIRKYPQEEKFYAIYNKVDEDRYFKDTIVPKGSVAQHISKDKKFDLKNDRMYVSVTDADKDKYVTAMTRELLNVFGTKSFKHLYDTQEDIRVPSKEKCIKTFSKIYNKHKEETMADLDDALDKMMLSDDTFSGYVLGYKWDANYDKNYTSAYDLMNLSLGIREMNNHTKTDSRFFKEMSKQGYNAIVDEFDNMSTLKSELPLIVFDAKKTLKQDRTGKLVTKSDLDKASKTHDLNAVFDEMEAFAKIANETNKNK